MPSKRANEHDYLFLSEELREETLVGYHHAQEADLHSHLINRERYEKILEKGNISDKFRARIQELLDQTNERIEEVETIIEHTLPQLPAKTKHAAITQRLRDKGHLP